MDPKAIKLFMFDYDGTLRDSMNPHSPFCKPEAFAKSVIDFHPELHGRNKELRNVYYSTSGINRIKQLHIAEEKLGVEIKVDAKKEKEWSDTFSNYIDEKRFPLFEDAISAVRELKNRDYIITIGSSVPQGSLEEAIDIFPQLHQYLDLILGNQKWSKGPGEKYDFIKGIPYFAYVCGKYDIRPNEIAYVGDTHIDVEAAHSGGAYTIGIYNTNIPESKEMLEAAEPDLLIGKLRELLDVF